MDKNKIIKELLEIVKANQWQTHHAAENYYCPYCVIDDEEWKDQKEHHKGCKIVRIINKAEESLMSN